MYRFLPNADAVLAALEQRQGTHAYFFSCAPRHRSTLRYHFDDLSSIFLPNFPIICQMTVQLRFSTPRSSWLTAHRSPLASSQTPQKPLHLHLQRCKTPALPLYATSKRARLTSPRLVSEQQHSPHKTHTRTLIPLHSVRPFPLLSSPPFSSARLCSPLRASSPHLPRLLTHSSTVPRSTRLDSTDTHSLRVHDSLSRAHPPRIVPHRSPPSHTARRSPLKQAHTLTLTRSFSDARSDTHLHTTNRTQNQHGPIQHP